MVIMFLNSKNEQQKMKNGRILYKYVIFFVLISCNATILPQNSKYLLKEGKQGYFVTIYNDKINWDNAVSRCNDVDATLVQLNNADVKNAVHDLIKSVQGVDYFWTGLTRTCKNCNDWIWVDGTATVEPLDWGPNEPNNKDENEDKVVIHNNKLYDTTSTFLEAAVICQAERNGYCEAYPNTCKHNGECSSTTNGPFYSCDCAKGYYGTTCADGYCEAHSNWCQNGATCLSSITSPFYSCNCASGYYGTRCGNEFCEANLNWCLNGGTCSSSTKHPFYSCSCAPGYYGARCGNKYCRAHNNPCKNGGRCSSTLFHPFYSCNCAPGFYSTTCQETYCSQHQNPCKNRGKCESNPGVGPFYICNCAKTGYIGLICNGALVELSSLPTTIGIVGGYVNIDVKITTYDGILTVKMCKDDTSKPLIQEKTNVGNLTATFTLFINGTSDEGNYLFVATPKSGLYTKRTTTLVKVHVNATIKSVSPSFIFSPVTNGSTKVNCAAAGIPASDVTWFYHSNEVAITGKRVYQTKKPNNAILHVKTATLNDKGKYTCVAKNKVGNPKLVKNSTEFIELAVYGSPNIKSIDASPCSERGRLTINWEPNNQTTSILHRFVAKSINSSVDQVFVEEKRIKEGATVVFDNLDPYTQYEITVVVCPDMCLSQLNDSRTQITGHGLPGAVTNGNVHENEDSCFVVWSQPNTPVNQIIGYEVSVADTWIYQPSDLNLSFTSTNSDNVNQPTLNYTLSTKFNRNYSFNVTAITCVGKGESVVANGRCKTRRGVPSVVPPATLSDATSISGKIREITVYLPSETNGPVSCMFVIVNKGNSSVLKAPFGITQLLEAAEAALLNNNTGVDYLSVAISRDDVVGGKFVTNLGNGNSTSCDITNLFTGNKLKKRSIGATNATYTGKNKPLLTKGTVYGFFIATTTPVEDGPPLFQIGELQSFINGKVESESESYSLWIIMGCVAAMVVVLIAGFVLFWKRKRWSKKDSDQNRVEFSQSSDGSEALYENTVFTTAGTDTDIPLKNLLQQYNLLAANGRVKFYEQFQKIKKTSKTFALSTTVGGSEPMSRKNRYKNILPYDSTRVKLKHNDGYINACNITRNKKKYIATQGPTPATVNDFWQMIVEQNCKVIVMLTKCNEAGKRKCEKYWPDCDKVVQHGDINVLNQEETYFGDYVRRILIVHATSTEQFEVIQYQFLKWPDHGVPATTSGLFRLHKAVTESYINTSQSAPLLVHCSAGVGRTGTYIGYDILCKETEYRNGADFYNCILSMRKERVDMVQTCDQYEILHKLILERYLFGETDISEEEIRANPERKQKYMNEDTLEQEFKNLSLAESFNNNSDGNDQNKARKNDVAIVRQPEDTEWITIEASYVQAYEQKTQLIAAQSPQNSTVEYFLRILLDNNIDIVVMMDQSYQKNSDDGVQYWPVSTNTPLRLENVTVRLKHEQILQGFVKRKLVVSRNNMLQRVVTQYHYTNWGPNEPPTDTTEIKELISAIQQHAENRDATVVLVHCSNGIGKSGVVCGLINILERIKQEQKMDVFQTVKDLRNLRPGMVQTLNQYKFCYEVGLSQLCPESFYENAALIVDNEEPLYQNLD